MRVSIVINTYNRRSSLRETLDSLRQLRYREFEVVVVNGPSTDGTDELLAEWQGSIKIVRCPAANLSVSRNIGIAAAAGDIVAFIDDDAIPDPQWLGNIIAGYDSEEIGAVGGLVYDSTGYQFQTKYIICDRFGDAVADNDFDPTPLFNIPGAPRYTAHLGTNTSFRRPLLLELGGFDEEFAYYLDETDLCLRVVDSGRVVKYVDDAFVHHKFAPSHLRNTRKSLVTRYEILKNKAYFALKHGGPAHGHLEAMQSIMRFVEHNRKDVNWCIENGRLPPETAEAFEDEVRRAVHDGSERALAGRRTYLSRDTLAKYAAPFKRFDREMIAPDRMTVCLFTQHYPPKPVDGIGRALYDFSRALAEIGHTVHILTASEIHNRVDLEEGVWVHRLAIKGQAKPFPDIPQHIWDYSRTMMDEVERIHKFDRVDLIEAPAWDCEGIAALLSGEIPVVTSLHTPMLIVASMHPSWLIDGHKMSHEIVPITVWERRVMCFSDGLAANTKSIVEIIEQEYDLALDRTRIGVVGRGFYDRTGGRQRADRISTNELRVLYLGRLEYRKGIDILIAALLRLLPEFPQLRVDIVGQDIEETEEPFEQQFLRAADGAPWTSNVTFHGRVEQELLGDYLEACDIFVAPSRFESFGLIYIEAMMYGKPVIGSDVGGIAEVIGHEETGLLVKPGDAADFEQALRRLILSEPTRLRLGEAGRRRYLAEFTAHLWAERSVALYKSIIAKGPVVGVDRPGPAAAIELSRLCDLSEFWVTAPLHPLLGAIGNGIIDRRLWAYCLAVQALRQKAPPGSADEKPKALVIGDRPAPDAAAYAQGWQVQEVLSSSTPLPGDFAKKPHRRLNRLGYGSGEFDLVLCLTLLDPLDEGFAAAVLELARVCRDGGSVHLLLALGGRVVGQAHHTADILEGAGLQAKLDLENFFRSAPLRSRFCAESIEPFLGATIAGDDRPVAALELERRNVLQKARPRLRPSMVDVR